MLLSLKIDELITSLYSRIFLSIDFYAPKLLWALIILVIGTLIAVAIYKATMYLYIKFKIGELIDKMELDFGVDELYIEGEETNHKARRREKRKLLTQRMRVDKLIAKSFAYYIFLVFFRFSVVVIGITEVEKFLADLIGYLPSLFIAVCIGFFGMRFSDTVYDVLYHTLELTRQKTSKIIAMGAKVIVLFFTIMLVLNYIKIVDEFIIRTILIGFVSMLSIACGLAFWLGGKDVAKEILESFRQ